MGLFTIFAPLIAKIGAGIFGWLERRRLIKAEFAKSFYVWVDGMSARQRIPAELRDSVKAQRKALDDLAAQRKAVAEAAEKPPAPPA